MTDCWGCSMLMNAAILNLTKIRKQYVSNMQARRAQEHTNFLVFRNFPFSIFNPFLQGAHLGLKWVWPKVVTNWQICELNKRLSANGSRRVANAATAVQQPSHPCPGHWAAVSKCQNCPSFASLQPPTSIILLYNLTLKGWFGRYKKKPALTMTSILKFVNHKTNFLLWAFIKLL